jgi:hypothetical protein
VERSARRPNYVESPQDGNSGNNELLNLDVAPLMDVNQTLVVSIGPSLDFATSKSFNDV